MKPSRKLIIWTLISNCLIVIVGYPPNFLLLCSLLTIPYLLTEHQVYKNLSDYDQRAIIACLLSLCGQITMLIFLLNKVNRPILLRIGLILMWLGLIVLVVKIFWQIEDQVSLLTGIPFIIFSGILIYKELNSQIYDV
jgi:hypothetical protein